MPDDARELKSILTDLRQYADKPFGSIRIDVREVKALLDHIENLEAQVPAPPPD